MSDNELTKEQELDQLRAAFKLKMCPVFRNNCGDNDCHSYNPGSVSGNGNGPIIPPYCMSPLVTGVIAYEQS